MDNKCPKCGAKLKKTNWKPNCSECGVNILYYGIEDRLSADAKKAEAEFARLNAKTTNMKKTLAGSPLAITRLVFVFIPLVILILPIAKVNLSVPFLETSSHTLTLISILTKSSVGGFLALAESAVIGNASRLFGLSIIMIFAAIAFGVLNFFVTLTGAASAKCSKSVFCNIIACLLMLASLVLCAAALSAAAKTNIDFFSGSISVCAIIGTLLFLINICLSAAVSKKLKSQQQ